MLHCFSMKSKDSWLALLSIPLVLKTATNPSASLVKSRIGAAGDMNSIIILLLEDLTSGGLDPPWWWSNKFDMWDSPSRTWKYSQIIFMLHLRQKNLHPYREVMITQDLALIDVISSFQCVHVLNRCFWWTIYQIMHSYLSDLSKYSQMWGKGHKLAIGSEVPAH